MKVGRQVAAGAAWMVGLKFIERGIGFVSTLILARLLLPSDFGLVAMAMAVFAFVEIAGSFGFDLALIRQRDASRAQYDSAWSLSVGYGALSGVALLALAYPTAAFFKEPRLLPVMAVLAAIAFVQGLENIGTVDFRKEFRFGKDFQLMLAKKLIAFVVTLALAVIWRNHWALLAGIAASRVANCCVSHAGSCSAVSSSTSTIAAPTFSSADSWTRLRLACTGWRERSRLCPRRSFCSRSCAPSSLVTRRSRTIAPSLRDPSSLCRGRS
jgi:O-antigen/teichoic acid export membrane protein